MPNVTQTAGLSYNYEVQAPTVANLTQQPSIRVDYQLSSAFRVTGKYSGQRARRLVTPGTIEGFNDVLNPYPYITNYGVTVNYTLNNSTYIEGTYGFIRNQLAGGASIGATGTGGMLVTESSNRLTSLPNFPLLYPNAGVVDERYYAFGVLNDLNPGWWDGSRINMPPAFGWGSRIQGTAGVGALPGPPNQVFPGFLNINRTQDVAISLTKVWGAHTSKAGFYNNHSFKAQNTGAGGVANLGFQGYVNFGNDTNNALDTGFGFANAAVGVFQQYLQQSKLIEGSMIYNNTEFYLQDNWKMNPRLTLDYGIRFTRQQPQYDQFLQMSNFFADQWSLASAPLLYLPGCNNGATVCSGNARNAVDPRTGQILTAPGAANTAAAIGTVVPGTGSLTNGIKKAGEGIAGHVVRLADARGGAAIRAGLRPHGQSDVHHPRRRWTVLRPPGRQHRVLDSGQPADLDVAGPAQRAAADAGQRAEHDGRTGADHVPVRRQAALVVAVAGGRADGAALVYGTRRFVRRQPRLQPAARVPGRRQRGGRPECHRYRSGVPPEEPGSDARAERRARCERLFDEPAAVASRPEQRERAGNAVLGRVPRPQFSVNRRFRDGLAFGTNYNLGLSLKGNTGLLLRLQHAADGTISVRSDQADYEKLNENLALQRHVIKSFVVWDIPNAPSGWGTVARQILNDWQLSGVLTAGSAFSRERFRRTARPRRTRPATPTAGTTSPISTRTTAPP
jgi:hypothetical protein